MFTSRITITYKLLIAKKNDLKAATSNRSFWICLLHLTSLTMMFFFIEFQCAVFRLCYLHTVQRYGVKYHLYADDTHLYVLLDPVIRQMFPFHYRI